MTAENSRPRGPSTVHERGALVSIEGLNGVGKTYLTERLITEIAAADPSLSTTAENQRRPVMVEEFSRRGNGPDLGRQILRALVTAADGDPFLRAGRARSETLLLLSIKLHDFETTRRELLAGRTVIEGRSTHSIAVYQSLILEPDDTVATALARRILDTAQSWRPLPDLTVVITDDPTTAVQRAEARDGRRYTTPQWRLHHRAAAMFDRLAADDPEHLRVIDRRDTDTRATTAKIRDWIVRAPRRRWEPEQHSLAVSTR